MGLVYDHVVSRGAHGVWRNDVFERLIEAGHKIWVANDGSGWIKTTRIGWSFFTEQQRAPWEQADHPPATVSLGPSLDSSGPWRLSPRPVGWRSSRSIGPTSRPISRHAVG